MSYLRWNLKEERPTYSGLPQDSFIRAVFTAVIFLTAVFSSAGFIVYTYTAH